MLILRNQSTSDSEYNIIVNWSYLYISYSIIFDMKKGSGKIIVIFGFAIFALILIACIFILKNNKNNEEEKNIVGSLINEESTNDEDDSEKFVEKGSNEKITNSQTNPDLESGCIIKQISYSMINLNKTSTCNQYQDDICIDKTTECSIEVHNRDNEIAGFFEIELIFIEEGSNKEIPLDSKTSKFFLAPRSYNTFKDSINIQSTEQDGPANKNIICLFNTLEVPKGEVCY